MAAKRKDLCKLIVLTLENALSEATGMDELEDAVAINNRLLVLRGDLRCAQEYIVSAGRTFTKEEIAEIVESNFKTAVDRRNRYMQKLLEQD